MQNYRGFNPRFTREGTVIDIMAGAIFGVGSLFLVAILVFLLVHFMRIKTPERGIFHLSIRYALFSVFLANLGWLVMDAFQGRYIGETGNFIVLHGLGFHALQALLLIGWLLEKSKLHDQKQRMITHTGCTAWTIAIFIVALQTSIGKTVFEISVFPLLTVFFLLIWLLIIIHSFIQYMLANRSTRPH